MFEKTPSDGLGFAYLLYLPLQHGDPLKAYPGSFIMPGYQVPVQGVLDGLINATPLLNTHNNKPFDLSTMTQFLCF